jgi:hypothetical protein
MAYTEKIFIVNLESEMQEIFSNVKKRLTNSLPTRFVSESPYSLYFLSKRYLECFSDMPSDVSQHIFLDYLDFGSDSYNPGMAARACEFYGGIMFEKVQSKKNILSISDFEFRLGTVYNLLAMKDPEFTGLSELSGHILEGFRNTTLDIRGSSILHFDFKRDR